MRNDPYGHEPVLIHEVIANLIDRPRGLIVDCTVGRGGHLEKMVATADPSTRFIALDVDPANLAAARERVGDQGGRVRYFHANFSELADVLTAAGESKPDALLADLGVSTNQLMGQTHGLSFSADAPLDMRLDPRIARSAADLLANLTEREIADMLYQNADERMSFRIARKIVQTRAHEPIRTTEQLARLVRSVLPRPIPGTIDPATRTFQALRMEVNAEKSALAGLLDTLPLVLAPQARAGIISFHSGEDRMVKQATRQWAADGRAVLINRKPIEPGDAELIANPRSRSAKLRVIDWIG
jgi:16S rRNA (cytosine1402-N4)-methyltransferase